MASLRKTLGTNLDATLTHSFEINRVFNMRNFTVEAKFAAGDPLAYPAAENDAELLFQDDESGSGSYETLNGGLVRAAGASAQAKIRIVDLDTQNVKIVWNPVSANGGTIESLTATFQS